MLAVIKAAMEWRWREKRKVQYESAMKTKLETWVKNDALFCSQPPIEKANSERGFVGL